MDGCRSMLAFWFFHGHLPDICSFMNHFPTTCFCFFSMPGLMILLHSCFADLREAVWTNWSLFSLAVSLACWKVLSIYSLSHVSDLRLLFEVIICLVSDSVKTVWMYLSWKWCIGTAVSLLAIGSFLFTTSFSFMFFIFPVYMLFLSLLSLLLFILHGFLCCLLFCLFLVCVQQLRNDVLFPLTCLTASFHLWFHTRFLCYLINLI